MSEPEVLSSVEGQVGRLTLNRPAAIHALTTDMVRLMIGSLLAWREDPIITTVLIDHAGERGFCAGGDIRFLAESGAKEGPERGAAAREFFFEEYRLNHLLFTYPKTVVAVMDGITMGGGVGISMPADYRIGTDRTAFAMPETGIGLFPDVGGGWHLPRLHGETGLWLALTGARLKAADCELLGITTDVVESRHVPKLKAEILARPGEIEEILTELELDPGPAPIAAHRDAIDTLFAHDSLEEIFAALESDSSPWAAEQLAILRTKSPLSMKTALRQLRGGATIPSFADEMAEEMRIAARIVVSHDFAEGVRAVIVDKDNTPHWHPPKLEGVTDKLLDAVFAPLPPDQEWSPLP
ncbi:MAG TPA: enoyl-CoA hydratase/isomerase family protein [Caulobacteraceae bacterium]|jgi:enoyl-CoA hydratase